MTPYSAVIAGGGPAGSALAMLLARWGRKVALVDPAKPRKKPPEETILVQVPVFERLGLNELLANSDAAGTPRHGAIWGSDELHWRDARGAGHGSKVDRERFDELLRERAADAGAELFDGWRVGGEQAQDGAVRLIDEAGRERVLRTRELVNATGTSSESRSARALPATFAIWGLARGHAHLDATLIEAVAEGWIWWLPLASGEVCVTLFADREELRERGVQELFSGALEGARGPARDTSITELHTTSATPRLALAQSGPHLVGAAATAIDPLSSQGIEAALASAEDAAYAVNTVLESPELRDEVRDARNAWESRLFDAHATKALAYYAAEQRFPGAPFWRTRHATAREWGGVVNALPGHLRPSPRLRACSALRRRGRRLVQAPGFRLGEYGTPLHAIGNVELTALFEVLEQSSDPRELVKLAARHAGLVALSPAALHATLLELLRTGFVVSSDG